MAPPTKSYSAQPPGGGSPGGPPLPDEFTSLNQILGAQLRPYQKVNVIGYIRDYQAPMRTRGTDWKYTLHLADSTTESGTVALSVFTPNEEDIPAVGAGDIAAVFAAEVQSRQDEQSLKSIKSKTEIHIYVATAIPPPPAPATRAHHPPRGAKQKVEVNLHEYVSWFHNADADNVVDTATFDQRAAQSVLVRNKFSLLSDVRAGNFYDVVVQIISRPWDGDRLCTLWVTDYTENDEFWDKSDGSKNSQAANPDPYGYKEKWGAGDNGDDPRGGDRPLPRGDLQVTCFQPHANAILESRTGQGEWVKLLNMHVKFGRNNVCLEGFLHEDRERPKTVQIVRLDPTDDQMDPHLREALHRKRNLKRGEAAKKRKMSNQATDQSDPTTAPKHSKARRAELRAAEYERNAAAARPTKTQNSAAASKDQPAQQTIDLNRYVVCEDRHKTVSSVQWMTVPAYYEVIVSGQVVNMELPFNNQNYLAHVRVVDFSPANICDFAYLCHESEYAALTDDEDGSGSDFDPVSSSPEGKTSWEWRFSLCLEDASSSGAESERKALWAVVINLDGQQLLGSNACDLRDDMEALERLRNRLSILWGDLAEHKEAQAAEYGRRMKRGGERDCPPLSSPPEIPAELPARPGATGQPFACLIRQYGIKVPEPDPLKADAGDGVRWEKIFGLWGTKICLPVLV